MHANSVSSPKSVFTHSAEPTNPQIMSSEASTIAVVRPILPTIQPEVVPKTAATMNAHTMYCETCVTSML